MESSNGSQSGANGEAKGADQAERSFPPRRKLTDEQELEVTRLYAETQTPVPEISKRFGIGESSVYRVAQRHGAALRGRTSTSGSGGGGTRGGAAAASTTSTTG